MIHIIYKTVKEIHAQYFTYLSSSSQLGHKAAMIQRHLCQSWAAVCASPHERPVSLSSATTVLRQVVLGLPGFLFPGGVHLSAVLGMRPCFILRTWPQNIPS